MEHPDTIWTVGHSSRTLEQFLALLRSQDVRCVADVRRYPGSRAHPHFNAEQLGSALHSHQIAYAAFADLGGRRRPDPNSTNTVWRNLAFRAYADYMETPEFRQALNRLMRVAREQRTAMLCSEAVWWRCHRSLIADALKVAGVAVLHIMSIDKVVEHPYTSAARIVDGTLRYGPGDAPAQQSLLE